ncbi:DUF6584 family protein [Streptomyces mirabilis]|uniref:DUF6584 family protein n=1 Tax=Streptomyces mirabilis TaxID=68239 RepID=UPI00367EC10E
MLLRDTVARVDADLAAGRVPVARQRLRGLVSSFPKWQGPESLAQSAFARQQLAAVRAACSEAMGHPVDWDTLPSSRKTDSRGSAFADFLAGAGCLVAVLAFPAIWVNGLVALFN